MLEKTIKQILVKKVNKWIDSITDESVKAVIRKDLIITGGCFTSFMQNEEPNDYDCYFRTRETVIKVAEYYAKVWNEKHGGIPVLVLDYENPSDEFKFLISDDSDDDDFDPQIDNPLNDGRIKMYIKPAGIVGQPRKIDEDEADKEIKKEKLEYSPVFISSNAITLSSGVQIIVRFFGEPDEIHDTFDFSHTKAYFDIKDSKVIIPKIVYECVMNKTLIYTGSKYPVCSLFRLRKFIQRGWTINAGQILRMSMQVSELDLLDINVLEDQLIGVDSLYFMMLINQFRAQKENKDFKLTRGYVEAIIDKIF